MDERRQLERLRKELGLDSNEALEILHREMQRKKTAPMTACPHCGKSLR